MKMKLTVQLKWLAPIVMACWGIGAAHAAPAINIGSMFEFVDSDKSTLLKRVRNGGDSTAFVKVDVSEVKYDAERKPTTDPVDSAAIAAGRGEGLIASPARLIVPAHGTQASRLLYRGARDVERYYRVRFMPVLPDKKDDFGITEAEREQYKDSMSAGVNVLAGYGAFVIVRPKQVRYDTQVTAGADDHTVANRGNSTIVLDAFYHCDADGEQCDQPVVHYILPGSQKTFPKTTGRHYRFQLIEGKQTRELRLDH
ncbi:hypothetical protein [Burkholderia diffusa]|uniref:hypothetical protein n=1 Tax=Burkholderia diffusa TaxID=488732 RepID=UPI0018C8C39E|nr:hypothetical protein [Burkholderia diffusa]